LGQDCRIASYLNGVDPENESDWAKQHSWLAKQLNDMHRVFAHRVKLLDAETSPVDTNNDRVEGATTTD
jgi:hypothetical protein